MFITPTIEESLYFITLSILCSVPAIALLLPQGWHKAVKLALTYGPALAAAALFLNTGYVPHTAIQGVILLATASLLSSIAVHLAVALYLGDGGHDLLEICGAVAAIMTFITIIKLPDPLPVPYIYAFIIGVSLLSALWSALFPSHT